MRTRTIALAALGLALAHPAPAQEEEPVLLVAIGVHVEPHGKVQRPRADYHDAGFFERDVKYLRSLAERVEAHGGKLVVQAQTPFTEVAAGKGEGLLGDLESRGHEIALHFHEDAHLGRGCERLGVDAWATEMSDEIEWLRKAGAKRIAYWSGGNLYPGVLEAAAKAGLSIQSDFKNPRTQRGDERLLGVHPWRPAAGPAEGDLNGFVRHDPEGGIVFLPGGLYPDALHGASGRKGYLETAGRALEASVAAARADRVNVFHLTIHPAEFAVRDVDAWIERWVDPLVRAGKVRWATFSGMAADFEAWEAAHPDVAPRPEPDKPKITFAINVHDFLHVDESADTLLGLVDLFDRHGVKGDFYLTAPMVELYLERRPEVVARIRETGMTVSYHVRPPHPLYDGFDQRLRGLDDAELRRVLSDYETYRLDLATGDLDRTRPGGYALVKEAFGTAPVTVGAPSGDPRLKAAALEVYRAMGAQVAIFYHESGTHPDRPFEFRNGLLARPSDFSVTRWKEDATGPENFWWNMLEGPKAAAYDPLRYLRLSLAVWEGDRAPFVTALIHENNFYRQGATPFAFVYYEDSKKTRPRHAPFDLEAPDASRPRSDENSKRILEAYEALVAHGARELDVVTSADLARMARSR